MGNGLNTPALLFGIILLVASIGLFFWGRLKPELARDSDNVYSIIGIISSVILFTSAFDLSLLLGFQQLLLIGSVIVLMWENIQKRTPTDAKRSFTSDRGGRDDDRGGRRPYRAERSPEYDEFAPPPRNNAGLRGEYQEPGYGNDAGYGDRALPRRDMDARDTRGRRDRPNRSARFEENDGPMGRDDGFGEPRQIPGRSGNSRPNEPDMNRPSDQPRRRPRPDDSGPRRPRPERVEDINADINEDIPSADYVDFTPIESVDPRPPSNSWGPNS